MPLLPVRPKWLDTPNGSIEFTEAGIVIAHPQGSKIVIGSKGIEMSCGAVSLQMTNSDVVISTGGSTIKLQISECAISAPATLKLNGAIVNVNNGALEVI